MISPLDGRAPGWPVLRGPAAAACPVPAPAADPRDAYQPDNPAGSEPVSRGRWRSRLRRAVAMATLLATSLIPNRSVAAPPGCPADLDHDCSAMELVYAPPAPGAGSVVVRAPGSAPVFQVAAPAAPADSARAAQAAAEVRLDTPALQVPGVSDLADDGISPTNVSSTAWRSFGHVAVNGQWFDRKGNWADAGTSVTADQFAAMPLSQQKTFAQRAGVKLERVQKGDPSRVLLQPASPGRHPGEPIDRNRSYDTLPDGSRSFDHRKIGGQYFVAGRWRDTGGLVSADQAAAMPDSQRADLAASLGISAEELNLGQPDRVIVVVDKSQDDARMAELAAKSPRALLVYRGYKMRAATALALQRLEQRVKQSFPDREFRITSAYRKEPDDPHGQGRAVDLVVVPLTRKETKILEGLARESGFRPYNEYIYDSPNKTGPHMHAQVPE